MGHKLLSIFRNLFLPAKVMDVIDKPLNKEQKQKEIQRLNREIIKCDDLIFQFHNNYDPIMVETWIKKKQLLEFEIEELETEEFI